MSKQLFFLFLSYFY